MFGVFICTAHDLDDALACIMQSRQGAVEAVGRRIQEATAGSLRSRVAGGRGQFAGTRELVISRLSCIVAYRVSGAWVDVLTILYGAHRWPSSLESE